MSAKKEFCVGQGKISAYMSVTMSLMALGAVLCFHFPDILTTAELREIYPVEFIRKLVWIFIVGAVVLGFLSSYLHPNKLYGLFAIFVSAIAALLGGGSVEYEIPVRKTLNWGLDWFILDLLLLSLIFIPLEKFAPLKPAQKIFRRDWRTDILHFCFNHILLQVILVFATAPAKLLEHASHGKFFIREPAKWPLVAQFLAIVLIVDFFQYWVHRAFHKIPALWKIHAIHHSVEEMDWLAGSRLHLIDIIVTRAVLFIPLTFLGFGAGPMQAYLVFAAFQTVFIHSNIRWRFPLLRWFFVTPAFHHWHHGSERAAIDKNFAVHLPMLDLIFGSLHFPAGKWPKVYGVDREKVPANYVDQLFYPFKRRR